MGLVIKKRVSLEFLGDDYAEGYLVFTAIPTSELGVMQEKALELQKKEEDAGASLEFLKEEVISRFVEGKIPQDGELAEITKSNITDLPSDVFIEAWQQMNGKLSPKA